MDFLRDLVPLYLLLAVLASGVGGVAIGLGSKWVGSVLREWDMRRALENAGARITRLTGEVSELRDALSDTETRLAVTAAESKMNASANISSQREIEYLKSEMVELRKYIVAGVTINAQGNIEMRDATGRDKTESA